MNNFKTIITILAASLLLVLTAFLVFQSQQSQTKTSDKGRQEKEAAEEGDLPVELTENNQFKFWIDEWQKIEPSLSPEEFTLEKEKKIEFPYTYPEDHKPDINSDNPQNKRYIFSPDGEKFIDYFACFGEADSCVNIYNAKSGQKLNRLLFCGTVCGYHYALWLDEQRFAVFGRSLDYFKDDQPDCVNENRSATCDQRITVDYYDLNRGTHTLFISSIRKFEQHALSEQNKKKFFNSLSEEEKEDWRFLLDS